MAKRTFDQYLIEWPERVETAISDFSRVAAQIGNADYLPIRPPAAGLAEYRTLMVVAANFSSGSIPAA
jgi:hypothetical protein